MPAPDAPASSTDRPTARVLDEPTECEIDPSVGGLPGGCVWWVLPLRGRRGARQHFHCAPQQGRRVHTHCTRDLSSYTQHSSRGLSPIMPGAMQVSPVRHGDGTRERRQPAARATAAAASTGRHTWSGACYRAGPDAGCARGSDAKSARRQAARGCQAARGLVADLLRRACGGLDLPGVDAGELCPRSDPAPRTQPSCAAPSHRRRP